MVDGVPRHELVISRQLAHYGGRHHISTTKSDAGDKRVPVGPELVAVLLEHIAKLEKVARVNT